MVKTAFGLPIPIFSLCLILHMSGEIWLSSAVQLASGRYVCPLAGRTPPFPSNFYPVVLGVRSSEPQRLLPQVNGQWRARQHCRHRSLKSNLQFKFELSKGDWRNESWCQLVMEDAAGRLLGRKMFVGAMGARGGSFQHNIIWLANNPTTTMGRAIFTGCRR